MRIRKLAGSGGNAVCIETRRFFGSWETVIGAWIGLGSNEDLNSRREVK
jgi:hypothetical protein